MRQVIIAKNKTILRRVCLPVHGNVKVNVEDLVQAGDVIAEMNLPERYEMIDIPGHFKVEPDQTVGMIKRLVGDVISKGDVLAQKDGFLTQLFRSPGDGKVISVREGRITLALGMKKKQVLAPAPGVVKELIPNRGAVLAITGAVLEGTWANGKTASGTLAFWDDLDKNALGIPGVLVRDKIVAFQKPATNGQIRRLLRLNPAGIVLPAVTFFQYQLLRESGIAVLSLLGFGEANPDPFSLAMLESMREKPIYLLGETNCDGAAMNPVLLLPGEQKVDLSSLAEEISLRVGATVRLRGKPYTGMVGVVKEIPETQAVFASGLKSAVVSVLCDGDQLIQAPLANVDLIQE